MASTSAPGNLAAYGKIKSSATHMYSDNQTLIAEIRKGLNMMREVAVDLEADNMPEFVKELENCFLDLLKASEESTHISSAIQSVGNEYQPGEDLTNFSKLFDEKIASSKAATSSISENHPWLRQFREAIWKVHHEGQVMPGEEEEDIVMTSTESSLKNTKCPLTGKPVTELENPVRSMDCKHIFEKQALLQHLRIQPGQCPVAGCPHKMRADRVACDPLLQIEIDEMRSLNKQSGRANDIEDFTALDEDD